MLQNEDKKKLEGYVDKLIDGLKRETERLRATVHQGNS